MYLAEVGMCVQTAELFMHVPDLHNVDLVSPFNLWSCTQRGTSTYCQPSKRNREESESDQCERRLSAEREAMSEEESCVHRARACREGSEGIGGIDLSV